jgi:hypothetical protein
MGLFGDIVGAVVNPVGTVVDYVSGGGGGGGGGGGSSSGSSDAAAANASRDAAIAQSNNNLMAMQAQVAVMELGILENSKNSQFQTLAWLTERMDAHDTKLQIATIESKQEIEVEQNRHIEAMAEARNRLREMESTSSLSADLPPPSVEFE